MAGFMIAADAVAAAVEIEKRGQIFYQNAVDEATDLETKDFFAFMVQEEKRHEVVFNAMLQRVGGMALPAGADEEEYLDYMKIVLDSHQLFLENSSIHNADPYAIAIQFEKDSIIFFNAMEKMVPENERAYVQRCITEEQGHIRLIARKKEAAQR